MTTADDNLKDLGIRLCDFFNKKIPGVLLETVGENATAQLVKPTWEGGSWKVVVKRADPKYVNSDPIFTIVLASPNNIKINYLEKWEKVVLRMLLELSMFSYFDPTLHQVKMEKIKDGLD